jgi:hypothetical protein
MCEPSWWRPGLLCAVLLTAGAAPAREIHVVQTGDDSASGSPESPFRTIGRAASAAQPGDCVTVHAGTYREWVKPARGGTSEQERIVYCAAPGDEVILKGSERITSWVRQSGGLWKVELPNSLFGPYNPYALELSGGWLLYGQWHHRGDVYLNGEAFFERQTLEEVKDHQHSWCCQTNGQTTTIWANFATADPNQQLAEINVRESVFMPEKTGLPYVTVDGFHLMHSAENWEPPGLELQTGMIGPRMGKHWIIQNCRITNARCVGIILGHAPGVDYDDINAFGDHVVRNNVIRRCGEAGIAGQKGATRCLIAGNLIEDTNYRREFGGWETAAIKFHESVDAVICGNLIRRVRYQSHGAFGIWMDWANQGTRITRNIIYDTETAGIFLEMDHGPILVDNNVVVGAGVRSNSEATVFAHNLFVDCEFAMVVDRGRASQYYKPHTRIQIDRKPGIHQDDQWFHNIFVRRGLDGVSQAPGYASDYNVFLEGAGKSRFGDEHSLVDPSAARFQQEEHPLGVTLRFSIPKAPGLQPGPWVDRSLVGVFPTVGQTIEDRRGTAIRVDEDIPGTKRLRPVPGPLAELNPGTNVITWGK